MYLVTIIIGTICSLLLFALNMRGLAAAATLQKVLCFVLVGAGIVGAIASLVGGNASNWQPIYEVTDPSIYGPASEGLKEVSHSSMFGGMSIAGKTGTAEEVKNGHTINHAFFVSFAPYDDPEIAVTVNIPYGYSSSNAATAAKSIYRFYYGYTDLDYILNNSALSVSNVEIGD